MTMLPALRRYYYGAAAATGPKMGSNVVVVASSRGLHVKNTTYMVKVIDGATLPVGVYQVAADAPDVYQLALW